MSFATSHAIGKNTTRLRQAHPDSHYGNGLSLNPVQVSNSGDLLRPPLVVVATDRHRGARRGLGWHIAPPRGSIGTSLPPDPHLRGEGVLESDWRCATGC